MVTAIVSSGYARDAALCRYEDVGFRGVIVKPYEAAETGTNGARRYRRKPTRLRITGRAAIDFPTCCGCRLYPVTDAKRRPGFPASAVAQAQPPLSLSTDEHIACSKGFANTSPLPTIPRSKATSFSPG